MDCIGTGFGSVKGKVRVRQDLFLEFLDECWVDVLLLVLRQHTHQLGDVIQQVFLGCLEVVFLLLALDILNDDAATLLLDLVCQQDDDTSQGNLNGHGWTSQHLDFSQVVFLQLLHFL